MIRNLAQMELTKRGFDSCPDRFMEWAFGDSNNILGKDAPGKYCSLHPDCESVSITDPIKDGTKIMVDEYLKYMKEEYKKFILFGKMKKGGLYFTKIPFEKYIHRFFHVYPGRYQLSYNGIVHTFVTRLFSRGLNG